MSQLLHLHPGLRQSSRSRVRGRSVELAWLSRSHRQLQSEDGIPTVPQKKTQLHMNAWAFKDKGKMYGMGKNIRYV